MPNGLKGYILLYHFTEGSVMLCWDGLCIGYTLISHEKVFLYWWATKENAVQRETNQPFANKRSICQPINIDL